MQHESLVTPTVQNTNPQTDKAHKKLPNLDALRFFLAFVVIIFHIPGISETVGLPSYDGLALFRKGGQAVYVFFVLSGFLIIRLLYIEKEKTATINIRDFYLRRMLRIYPVYYIVLIVGLLFYHVLLPLAGIKFDIQYTLAEAIFYCVGFLPNVLKAKYEVGAILFILWSIGIEEQFYLFIAPVVKFVKIQAIPLLLIIFTVAYLLFYFSPIFEGLRKYQFLYFYFSLGGFISILAYQGKLSLLSFKNKYVRLLLYFGFLLTFLMAFPKGFFYNLYGHGAFAVLTSLTILNLSEEDTFIVKNRFINYLGKISYGLYMYHIIVIYVVLFGFMKVKSFIQLDNISLIVLINVTTFLVSILVSHISYVLIEKRVLTLKNKIRHTS